MKEVAKHDRPREKLQRLGVAALGDNELVAIVLGSGVPDCGALQLANRVLQRAGGLRGLARASADQICVHGVGPTRAAQVVAAVVLFHNHPSGDPMPSNDDLTLTDRMIRAGEIMGIDVLDHLILSEQRYYSLVEAGRVAGRSGKIDRL